MSQVNAGPIIVEFVHAIQVFNSPKSLSDAERQRAEEVITSLKHHSNVFQICQEILNRYSKHDQVIFYTITALRESLINKWPSLSDDDVNCWRELLFHYLFEHKDLAGFVVEQILRLIAIVFKQQKCLQSALYKDIVHFCEQTLSLSIYLGCQLMYAVVNEFIFLPSNASNLGLTLEGHMQKKKIFQNSILVRLLVLTIDVLKQSNRLSNVEFKKAILLFSTLLNWDFTVSARVVLSQIRNKTSFDPGVSWRSVIYDESLLPLIFSLKHAISDEQTLHIWFICLTQLASLKGDFFSNTNDKVRYYTQLLCFFNETFTQVTDNLTAFGIASIVNRLAINFSSWFLLQKELVYSSFRLFSQLTCAVCALFAEEELVCDDEQLYSDSLQLLLAAWTLLLDSKNFYLGQDFLGDICYDMACAYLRCRLAPPDGNRLSKNEAVEINEMDDIDRELFRDQLDSIAVIMRVSISKTSKLLIASLQSRIRKLQELLAQKTSNDDLFEDIHWLLLLSAHLIGDHTDGEVGSIPQDVMDYSLTESDSVNSSKDAIHSLFLNYAAAHNVNTDSVVKLVAVIFQLSNLENDALFASLDKHLSPQVGSTLVWTLGIIARVYLAAPDNPTVMQAAEFSKSLLITFSTERLGATLIEFLMRKVHINLMLWSSDALIIDDSLDLFSALMEDRFRRKVAVSSSELDEMITIFSENFEYLKSLPWNSCHILMKNVLRTAGGKQDLFIRLMDQFFLDHFLNALSSPLFNKNCHNSNCIQTTMISLQLLRGVVITNSNSADVWKRILEGVEKVPYLFSIYSNYNEVELCILQLVADCAITTPSHHYYKLSRVCKSILDQSLCFSNGVDFENHEQLTLLLDLVNNYSNGVISANIFLTCENAVELDEMSTVVVFGLQQIVKCMTESMLRLPTLTLAFYNLIVTVCQLHCEKLNLLSDEVFQSITNLLITGTTDCMLAISKYSLEASTSIAIHCLEESRKDKLLTFCQKLLPHVYNGLLERSISRNVSQTSGECLFYLIKLFPEDFSQLCSALLQHYQHSQQTVEILSAALNSLTAPINESGKRQAIQIFSNRLETFLENVCGFLQIV